MIDLASGINKTQSNRSFMIVFVEMSLAGFDALPALRKEVDSRIVILSSDADKLRANRNARYVDQFVSLPRTRDKADIQKAITDLLKEGEIGAVVALTNTQVLPVAEISEAIGTRALNAATARLCSDKFLLRQRLAEKGLVQPRFRLAQTRAEAVAAAEFLGRGCIAKPVNGRDSDFVQVINSPDEAGEHFDNVGKHVSGPSQPRYGSLLFEDFVQGPLISIETMSREGTHEIIGSIDRILEPRYFAELGGTFSGGSVDQPDAAKVTRLALDAIGFDSGPAHTELVLSPDGPKIIEINPRLASGPAPYMMSQVLGSNIIVNTVKHFLGLPVRLGEPRGFSTARALIASQEGRLTAIELSPRRTEPSVAFYEVVANIGEVVRPPRRNSDRLGFVVAGAKDRLTSIAIAEAIRDQTRFKVAEEV